VSRRRPGRLQALGEGLGTARRELQVGVPARLVARPLLRLDLASRPLDRLLGRLEHRLDDEDPDRGEDRDRGHDLDDRVDHRPRADHGRKPNPPRRPKRFAICAGFGAPAARESA
jgi:hypothetical protein